MNKPLCCQFSICTFSATHRCSTCDLWTCNAHSDHGPDGNGPHVAAGTEAAEIVSLRAQLRARTATAAQRLEQLDAKDRELAALREEIDILTNAADAVASVANEMSIAVRLHDQILALKYAFEAAHERIHLAAAPAEEEET